MRYSNFLADHGTQSVCSPHYPGFTHALIRIYRLEGFERSILVNTSHLGLAGEHMKSEQCDKGASGSVSLLEGTISAIEADSKLAKETFSISVLEGPLAIGGMRPQLVKILPTNAHEVSIISPDLIKAGVIYHTSLSTCAEPNYGTATEQYYSSLQSASGGLRGMRSPR
jgi:hypothetical protein